MRKLITFTATAMLMASAFGAGEVYRWRGADGTWHYSDQPRPGAELVVSSQRSLVTPLPDSQPAQPVASPAPAEAESENLPVSDEVAREVRATADALKAEQCKKAQDNYQRTLEARCITRTDDQGNKTFLNSAEIDAARLQARANRDLACGPGN
jgi:hypothetical protein